MKIQISTDSTCDLGAELIQKYDIAVAPLYVAMGDRTLRDGIEVQPRDLYDFVAAGGPLCSTSAVNAADYTELFGKLRESADAVIHISLSSEISSCYQNACIAAQEIENVYVVDSRQLSTGQGLLVLAAADAAAQGGDAAEIAEKLRGEAEKISTSFIMERLDYMRKGGRCSTIAALGANLLKLKPSIRMEGGKLSVAKKYRGTTVKCVKEYLDDELGDGSDVRSERAFLTHSGMDDAVLAEALRAVEEKHCFREVFVTHAGCTICGHCGPGTLGVLYVKK